MMNDPIIPHTRSSPLADRRRSAAIPFGRATGISAYLKNGCTTENAQAIANLEFPKTTKLYDRTSDQNTLDEIERMAI
jgi:hypothetical protein